MNGGDFSRHLAKSIFSHLMRHKPINMFMVLLAFSLVFGLLFLFIYGYTGGPLKEETQIHIKKGIGIHGTAETLKKTGIISSEILFKLTYGIFYLKEPLRAGEYDFLPHTSLRDVLEKVIRGDVYYRKLTIPEGLTAAQIGKLLLENEALDGELPATIKEGSLLPETYKFVYGETRTEIVERMQKAQEFFLGQTWSMRANNLPIKTPKEAIILASIVERETSVDSERRDVAAVFINRMRIKMRLQSDPTVIYALTQGLYDLKRPLTRKDLQTTSLYNTYTRTGLPPGPISNPGKASIEAVLNPSSSKALYFVADGTGGHAFAKTLAEHNDNVKKWRQIQKLQKPATSSTDKPKAAAPEDKPKADTPKAPPLPEPKLP